MGILEFYFVVTPSSTREEMLLEDAEIDDIGHVLGYFWGKMLNFGASRRLFNFREAFNFRENAEDA